MTTERPPEHEPTQYVNVDLDILSRVPLDGLIHAMGGAVFVLYVGGERRKYEAHVELASSNMSMTADRTIVGLTRLIQRLPPRHRKIWDRAQSREFNVGIEAGLGPHAFELRLKRSTLEAITGARATLVVTVYAPDLQESRTSRPVRVVGKRLLKSAENQAQKRKGRRKSS